jgi:hypothetical protein
MASSTLYVYSLIAAVVLYVAQYVIREKIRMSKYKLPATIPGGLPIVGNTFQMPPTQQGPWAKKMAEKYGEMYVNLFSFHAVIIDEPPRMTPPLMVSGYTGSPSRSAATTGSSSTRRAW